MANNFKTIYVLKFNNYYNRILKHYETLAEYLSAATEYEAYININFNPGNGVSTEQILNQSTVAIDEMDYVLVVEPTYSTIESRWFILQTDRTRLGQYNLSLKRDIVADNYESILNTPMFIEKASVSSKDPAIYNSEDMEFNEIKSKETLLKDISNTPWIALYFAQGLSEEISGQITVNGRADYDMTGTSHDQWEFYGLTNKKVAPSVLTVGTLIEAGTNDNPASYYRYTNAESAWTSSDYAGVFAGVVATTWKRRRALTNAITKDTYTYSDYITSLTATENWLTEAKETLLNTYNNKTIAFSDGVYKVSITKGTYSFKKEVEIADTLYTRAKAELQIKLNATGIPYSIDDRKKVFIFKASLADYTVVMTKVANYGTTYDYSIPTGHNKTEDQPYDICLIPFDTITLYEQGQENTLTTTDKTVSLLVAKDIIEKNKGSNKLIDAQIVPYFPNIEWVVLGHQYKINLDNLSENINYSKITSNNDTIPHSIIFYASKASFTNRIGVNDIGDTWVIDKDAVEWKVRLECDKYRLCSPNYNGVFEFSPIKAGYTGSAINFDVDCTYMPQTPYIHLYPVFKAGSLYGGDYNDARGLICGGDFSIAQSSDAWATYQAQHKNYQVAFNREIEHIETTNKFQRVSEVASGVAGTASAMTNGYKFGGGAGAAISGVLSAAGAAADISISESLRKETLDLTKDQFGYNLQNIKALPDSLVKTTAYNYNNKYYPFVEYYTCTDIEKEALRNKIKYNGMKVMRIGTINEFITSTETYIKGKLIRLENFPGNNQELLAIAVELNQGLYIKGE